MAGEEEEPEQHLTKMPLSEEKFREFFTKMALLFKPSCFARRKKKKEIEQNKAWLLAESGSESNSLNSSFRFSIFTPLDLDSMNSESSSSSKLHSLENTVPPLPAFLIRFNFRDIAAATDNFSAARLLGRGALSYVFWGKIGFRRTAVAVKRLDKQDKETPKSFCRELMIASSLRHRHVVPLIGYCIAPGEGLFLVYRYVSGGNLERCLHERKKGQEKLPWSSRYNVALGIAKAIAYLHEGTEKCVVHRDIKPSNILLTSRKTPMLCDFGLATWTPSASSPFLCKTVKGTFGYLAPEYFQNGKVSGKTDVYALGVVLLELISGRKAVDVEKTPGKENLVVWAKALLMKDGGAVEELLDPDLKGQIRKGEELTRMISAAAACVRDDERRRPNLEEILGVLRGEKETECGRKRKTKFSGVLDCYSQAMKSEKEMNQHMALAMLGAAEFDNDEFPR